VIESVSNEETPSEINLEGIEASLRYLGRQTHGILPEIIEHGLEDPTGPAGVALTPLTHPLQVAVQWTAKERALALWALIEEGVKDSSLGPSLRSRKRHAVAAALRLPIDGISADSWGGSLGSRFGQLNTVPNAFGKPSTTQPMEVAWSSGVRVLAAFLRRRLQTLRSIEDWEPYRPHDMPPFDFDEWITEYDERARNEHSIVRRPSENAQKVFHELQVVTVHMRGRTVHRRVTERLVTSRDPHADVAFFTVNGYRVGDSGVNRTYVPARSVWGCREQIIESERAGHAPVTRLWFPEPLKYGEQAYFASEMVFEEGDPEDWVDVEVDHHGIAPGRLLHRHKLPIGGLTIRVRFDNDFLPEAAWWYAELTESERYVQPPPRDRHLLSVMGGAVQYTFVEHLCEPREHYGLAFSWPTGSDGI
jgi:hypothetical protein